MANVKPNIERVELFVPKGFMDSSPNYLIAVNGKNYVIPKGKTVMVPKFVKAEYDRACAAMDMQDERREELLAEATRRAKEYGLS